jgi:hypothetical protein
MVNDLFQAFSCCLCMLKIKADIPGPLRYSLITLKPLRGPSVGVQPPTDAEKSDKVKITTSKQKCYCNFFPVISS